MTPTRAVLVIDDYAEIRELVRLALSDRGFRVRTAENGAAALETIADDTFSVILIDVQMPVMDGTSFVEAYRTFPGHQARLVVMTAGTDARQYADQVAADSYLAKPFDLDELVRVVDSLARRPAADEETEGQAT